MFSSFLPIFNNSFHFLGNEQQTMPSQWETHDWHMTKMSQIFWWNSFPISCLIHRQHSLKNKTHDLIQIVRHKKISKIEHPILLYFTTRNTIIHCCRIMQTSLLSSRKASNWRQFKSDICKLSILGQWKMFVTQNFLKFNSLHLSLYLLFKWDTLKSCVYIKFYPLTCWIS